MTITLRQIAAFYLDKEGPIIPGERRATEYVPVPLDELVLLLADTTIGYRPPVRSWSPPSLELP